MSRDAQSLARMAWLRRNIAWIASLLAVVVGYFTLPGWVGSWWSSLRSAERYHIAVRILNGCLIAFGATFIFATTAGLIAAARVVTGRRRALRRPLAGRVLLLSVACFVGLGMIEAGAWGLSTWAKRPLPVPPVPPPQLRTSTSSAEELTLLVIGESSAEGQPFEPWFSIGHVLAWQLERARPGRKVNLAMSASGGVPLGAVLWKLGKETRRPDIVLLYAGHNEFQARFGWDRNINYYPEDGAERPRDGFSERVGNWTPFTRLIRETIERQTIELPPLKEVRSLVDRPICDVLARDEVRTVFTRELETLVTWCERAGAVPILIVPAGNDAGFDPDRSVLAASTRKAERQAFAAAFEQNKKREADHPNAAIEGYKRLIDRQPLFAEAHFRCAHLLAAKHLIKEAKQEYAKARDLDGLPMRCPSDFQQAFFDVARKRSEVVLVDGPRVLTKLSPTGLLDDHLFHDGHHPSFRAYLALAQEALDQLSRCGRFGLAEAELPALDPAETAKHFELDRPDRWALICRRAASFWGRLAPGRYDSSDRHARAERLNRAADAIERGVRPEDAGVPGLGVHPAGFP